MSAIDQDLLDDEKIPAQTVEGLAEATQHALNSDRPIVLVRDGKLVRICGDDVVLKEMPARRKVTVRRKVATS